MTPPLSFFFVSRNKNSFQVTNKFYKSLIFSTEIVLASTFLIPAPSSTFRLFESCKASGTPAVPRSRTQVALLNNTLPPFLEGEASSLP